MVNDTTFLHPAVVAPTDDFSIQDQHRADRNPAFGASLTRLLDRGQHEGVWRIHINHNIEIRGLRRQGPMARRLDTRPAARCHFES